MKKNRLLFVCLGNICRSPAAEGVMRRKVEQKGCAEYFEIDSAGIGGWHVGQLPDVRMRKAGAARGYAFNSHARQFAIADFDTFDSILAMDNENVKALRALAPTPQAAQKIVLLAEYAKNYPEQKVVPDPYYGTEADFAFVLDLIEDACDGLLATYHNVV